jgi:hypothetical protein
MSITVMQNRQQEMSTIKYRPEGWINPYSGNPSCEFKDSIFEAGANAMLWMLIEEARKYSLTNHNYMRNDDYLCDVIAHNVKL